MSTRETYYGESLAESSTSLTSLVTKMSLQMFGTVGREYFVIATAAFKFSDDTADAFTRVNASDLSAMDEVIGESNIRPKDSSDYYSVFAIGKFTYPDPADDGVNLYWKYSTQQPA